MRKGWDGGSGGRGDWGGGRKKGVGLVLSWLVTGLARRGFACYVVRPGMGTIVDCSLFKYSHNDT